MDTSEPFISMVRHVLQADDAESIETVTGEEIAVPTYAGAFACIGADCEDDCCHSWNIPLDKKTYERYQQFPLDGLGATVAAYVQITPSRGHDNLFAEIEQAESGACPFYTQQRLCGIQKTYGPQLLSSTCSSYPRVLNRVDGRLEGSLSLSCPQAARDVLLVPESTKITSDLLAGAFRTDNYFTLASNRDGHGHKPYAAFQEVRQCLIALITDRTRPMWERLLLVGSFCERLDTIAEADVPSLLAEYRAMVGTAAMRTEMENLPADGALKLTVIFRLLTQRIEDKTCGRRFLDTYWEFIEGVGSVGGDGAGEELERMRVADEMYCRPFFAARPYIFENYLLNYLYRTLFPFGRARSAEFIPRSIFDEYLLMSTQFAILHGLLLGIAANYKERFSEAHVIKTIQSFTREVDHDPLALSSIVDFMHEAGLATLAGVSVLLKR